MIIHNSILLCLIMYTFRSSHPRVYFLRINIAVHLQSINYYNYLQNIRRQRTYFEGQLPRGTRVFSAP